MKTTIQVTQEHIDLGVRDNCETCPIALAVNEVLKEPFRCWADEFYIAIYRTEQIGNTPKHDGYEVDLPGFAQQFICDFDLEARVEPFSFEIEIEDIYLKEAA